MNTIVDIWTAWTAEVQLPGNVSLDEATDIAQSFAPTLSDADGDAWWNAVAVYLGGDTDPQLNIFNPATYVGLRNFANNNEGPANNLFLGLQAAINFLPETVPVNTALAAGNDAEQLAAIPGNITDIEALKTGGTTVSDQQFDTALDQAIIYLQALEVQLS